MTIRRCIGCWIRCWIVRRSQDKMLGWISDQILTKSEWIKKMSMMCFEKPWILNKSSVSDTKMLHRSTSKNSWFGVMRTTLMSSGGPNLWSNYGNQCARVRNRPIHQNTSALSAPSTDSQQQLLSIGQPIKTLNTVKLLLDSILNIQWWLCVDDDFENPGGRWSGSFGGQHLVHPQLLPNWVRPAGEAQLWRNTSHRGGHPLHPLHRGPLREGHGLHLRHVLPPVLDWSPALLRPGGLWDQPAGGGVRVHQPHLGSRHLLCQWKDRSLSLGN